jgi:hypothetical protein
LLRRLKLINPTLPFTLALLFAQKAFLSLFSNRSM